MYKEGDKVLILGIYAHHRESASTGYSHVVRIKRGSGLVYVPDDNICSLDELKEQIRSMHSLVNPADGLDPCPFCGGLAELIETPHVPRGTDYTPRCINTWCCGRLTKKWAKREDAITAWNRRKTDGN